MTDFGFHSQCDRKPFAEFVYESDMILLSLKISFSVGQKELSFIQTAALEDSLVVSYKTKYTLIQSSNYAPWY